MREPVACPIACSSALRSVEHKGRHQRAPLSGRRGSHPLVIPPVELLLLLLLSALLLVLRSTAILAVAPLLVLEPLVLLIPPAALELVSFNWTIVDQVERLLLRTVSR